MTPRLFTLQTPLCTNNHEIVKNIIIIIRCRKCGNTGESIEHVIGGWPALAETAYFGRHNQLGKLIHQKLGFKYGLLDQKSTTPYYKYTPIPVGENTKVILYWDILIKQSITTDRTFSLSIKKKQLPR